MESSLNETQQNILKILLEETDDNRHAPGRVIARRLNALGLCQFGQEEIRQVIHQLRVMRYPVLSSAKGYYYARTTEVLSKYLLKLEERMSEEEEIRRGLVAAFDNIGMPAEPWQRRYVTKMVRIDNQTVREQKFPVGADGEPIIPPGTQLA